MPRDSVGCYRGVFYRRQRICDVLAVETKARWYFTYYGGEATSDHFPTVTALKQAVDAGEICDPKTGNPVTLTN